MHARAHTHTHKPPHQPTNQKRKKKNLQKTKHTWFEEISSAAAAVAGVCSGFFVLFGDFFVFVFGFSFLVEGQRRSSKKTFSVAG